MRHRHLRSRGFTATLLLQADGRKIHLFPAWTKNWDCKFKLHAPYNTAVEGVIKSGKLEQLTLTPKAREKDLIIMNKSIP